MNQLNRKAILLVDDEPDLLEIYRTLFADCPFDFVEAANGVEGFIEMNERKFDLILTDISMPLVDGKMLIEEVVASKTNAKTPIVVVSGYLTDSFKQQYQSRSNVIFFDKPIDHQTLYDQVIKILA